LNFLSTSGFDITNIKNTESDYEVKKQTIEENDNLKEYMVAWAENSIAE
jgi:hypothetical protein